MLIVGGLVEEQNASLSAELYGNKTSNIPDLQRYPFGGLLVENEAFWSILDPPENQKSVQNRTFEHRRALGPSKNVLWEGVRKKNEKSMKNEAKNH